MRLRFAEGKESVVVGATRRLSASIDRGCVFVESDGIESVAAITGSGTDNSSLSLPKAGMSDDNNNSAMIYKSDVLNVGVESA